MNVPLGAELPRGTVALQTVGDHQPVLLPDPWPAPLQADPAFRKRGLLAAGPPFGGLHAHRPPRRSRPKPPRLDIERHLLRLKRFLSVLFLPHKGRLRTGFDSARTPLGVEPYRDLRSLKVHRALFILALELRLAGQHGPAGRAGGRTGQLQAGGGEGNRRPRRGSLQQPAHGALEAGPCRRHGGTHAHTVGLDPFLLAGLAHKRRRSLEALLLLLPDRLGTLVRRGGISLRMRALLGSPGSNSSGNLPLLRAGEPDSTRQHDWRLA